MYTFDPSTPLPPPRTSDSTFRPCGPRVEARSSYLKVIQYRRSILLSRKNGVLNASRGSSRHKHVLNTFIVTTAKYLPTTYYLPIYIAAKTVATLHPHATSDDTTVDGVLYMLGVSGRLRKFAPHLADLLVESPPLLARGATLYSFDRAMEDDEIEQAWK